MANIIPLTQFDFHHQIAKTPGITIVCFTRPGCGACKQIIKTLAAYDDITITVYEVNAEQDTALVNEFEVFHLPSLFLYQHGHFHRQLHSQGLLEYFSQEIEATLAQPPEDMP